jgi:hypothetical protein
MIQKKPGRILTPARQQIVSVLVKAGNLLIYKRTSFVSAQKKEVQHALAY